MYAYNVCMCVYGMYMYASGDTMRVCARARTLGVCACACVCAVAYLGGEHGAMSTPFRAAINFFQHVIIYFAKIVLMDLLQANQVQRKVRYFINYSHRDIDLD